MKTKISTYDSFSELLPHEMDKHFNYIELTEFKDSHFGALQTELVQIELELLIFIKTNNEL